jgi:hypothetical protein
MQPRPLVRFTDPVTGQEDANHWLWIVGVSTDARGKTWWDASFSTQIIVGHVRVYTGRVVTGDPFYPDGSLLLTGTVVPRRIRGYEQIPRADNPFDDTNVFRCDSDPTAPAGDGDIDLTRCRHDADPPSRQIATPAYQPFANPSITQDVRTPLTWVAEFDRAFPPPTLANGDGLWIEFTLQDAGL